MDQIKSQNGQMLLIVVLVMVVALTVALSVATRSITNVKISKQNEESQRAFQAAEAGLELNIRKALEGDKVKLGGDKEFNNNASFTLGNTTPLASQGELNGGDPVAQDRGIDVWLMDYDAYKKAGPNDAIGRNVNNFVLHWGDHNVSSCSDLAAIEILVLVGTTKTNAKVEKHVYDLCNKFSAASVKEGTDSSPGYKYKISNPLSFPNGIVMKVIPIGNPAKMFISGTNLPAQGKLITSEGKAGDTVRKLEYTQFYPEIPTEMFYALLTQ